MSSFPRRWATNALSSAVKRSQSHQTRCGLFVVRLGSTTSASTHKKQTNTEKTSAKSGPIKIKHASSFGYMFNSYNPIFNQQSQQQGRGAPMNMNINTQFSPAAMVDSGQRAQSPRTAPRRNSSEKSVPSAESGGVPNPTPAYLQNASLPPFLLPYPRNILVVIDLNGTLLYRPSKLNSSKFVQRPHAKEFLSYCINTFNVAIWSSSKPHNVTKMVNVLLTKKQKNKLVAIWGRDRFGLSPADYENRVQCYKRLSTLWQHPDVMAKHPQGPGHTWSQRDTVLIDDSFEKARSEPHNLIPVPEFFGEAHEQGNVLPQVHDYINICSQQADISTYIRQSPFKLRENYTLG